MEMTSYMQAGAGLLVVLGLIALAAFIARKAGLGGGGRWREDRRLGVVEAMTLDPKRRVLLIRCDSKEHLVLLGPNSETVLSGRESERPIEKPAPRPATSAPATSDAPAREPTVSTQGPSLLSKLPRHSASTAHTGHRDKRDKREGRREPQLGPIPTRRDPK